LEIKSLNLSNNYILAFSGCPITTSSPKTVTSVNPGSIILAPKIILESIN